MQFRNAYRSWIGIADLALAPGPSRAQIGPRGPQVPPDIQVGPTGPPLTIVPEPCILAASLSPSPLVAGGRGYVVTATVCNRTIATVVATGLLLTASASSGNTTFWSSQRPVQDLPGGQTVKVEMPAGLRVPFTATHVDVTVTVRADSDGDLSDNVAVVGADVVSLPASLIWGGFSVRIDFYAAGSSLQSLSGGGRLMLPGVNGASIPVSFAGVTVDAGGTVRAGPDLLATAGPPAMTTGANGAQLSISQARLPVAGPATVSGSLALPAGAGMDAIDGQDSKTFAGLTLTPDGTLRGLTIASLDLRDLPMRVTPAAAVDVSLSADTLFQLAGTTAPNFAYDPTLPPDPELQSTNDGLLMGSYSLTGGALTSHGLTCTLTLKLPTAAPLAFRLLFPRVSMHVAGALLQLAGSHLAAVDATGGYSFDYVDVPGGVPGMVAAATNAHHVDSGGVQFRNTDDTGSLTATAGIAQPNNGVFAWDNAVFSSHDSRPVFWAPGGRTSARPYQHFQEKAAPSAAGFVTQPPGVTAPIRPGLNLVTAVTGADMADLHLSGATVQPAAAGDAHGGLPLPGPSMRLYVRPSGVSGVWGSGAISANSPAHVDLWGQWQVLNPGTHAYDTHTDWGPGQGFPLSFTNVAVAFLDSGAGDSRLDGTVTLHPPANTGQAGDAQFPFQNIGIDHAGRLTQAGVQGAVVSAQQLGFWGVWATPSGVGFDRTNDSPDRTHYLTFDGRVRVNPAATAPTDPSRYVSDDLTLEGLWFGADGWPAPGRTAVAHAPAGTQVLGFPYYPSGGLRLSGMDTTLPPLTAAIEAPPARRIGYVVLPGVVHLTYFGDKPTEFWIGSNTGFVAPAAPVHVDRDLFAGLNVNGDMVFFPEIRLAGRVVSPTAFLMQRHPNALGLPQGLLQTDVMAQVLNTGDARLFMGVQAGAAISAWDNVVSKIPGTGQQVADALGIPGMGALDSKAWNTAVAADDWVRNHCPTGINCDNWTAAGDLVIDAQNALGDLYTQYQGSNLMHLVGDIQAISDAETSFGNSIPIVLKFLRGSMAIHDDQWDNLQLQAGARIPHVVQDATISFSANRHNEYRLDLQGQNITLPLLDVASLSPAEQVLPKSGKQGISSAYLRLLVGLGPHPRLDGAFGLGRFTPLALINPLGNDPAMEAGESQTLTILHVDGAFGIGVTGNGAPIIYVGAALGVQSPAIGSVFPIDGVEGGFLIGTGIDREALDIICPDNSTGVVKAGVKKGIREGLTAASGDPNASMTGLALEVGFDKNLIDSGCWLTAGCGIDAAVWLFLVSAANSGLQPVVGGRLAGEAHAQAACLASAKGSISLLANVLPHLGADPNVELIIEGMAGVEATVNLLIHTLHVGANITVTVDATVRPLPPPATVTPHVTIHPDVFVN